MRDGLQLYRWGSAFPVSIRTVATCRRVRSARGRGGHGYWRRIVLLIGRHAQRWHLGAQCGPTVTRTVADWREYVDRDGLDGPATFCLPHPSWRNNAWIKSNPWLEDELIVAMRAAIAADLQWYD